MSWNLVTALHETNRRVARTNRGGMPDFFNHICASCILLASFTMSNNLNIFVLYCVRHSQKMCTISNIKCARACVCFVPAHCLSSSLCFHVRLVLFSSVSRCVHVCIYFYRYCRNYNCKISCFQFVWKTYDVWKQTDAFLIHISFCAQSRLGHRKTHTEPHTSVTW